eukprot:2820316-Rhodomonas_salina.2
MPLSVPVIAHADRVIGYTRIGVVSHARTFHSIADLLPFVPLDLREQAVLWLVWVLEQRAPRRGVVSDADDDEDRADDQPWDIGEAGVFALDASPEGRGPTIQTDPTERASCASTPNPVVSTGRKLVRETRRSPCPNLQLLSVAASSPVLRPARYSAVHGTARSVSTEHMVSRVQRELAGITGVGLLADVGDDAAIQHRTSAHHPTVALVLLMLVEQVLALMRAAASGVAGRRRTPHAVHSTMCSVRPGHRVQQDRGSGSDLVPLHQRGSATTPILESQ